MVDSSLVIALAHGHARDRARAIACAGAWTVISSWAGGLARAYDRAFIRDRG